MAIGDRFAGQDSTTIRRELAVPDITMQKIVGLVFLYASAAFLNMIGNILFNIVQLRGISSVFYDVSSLVGVAAIVLTVYITGHYLYQHIER
jgi:hypothetical protein